MRNVFDKPSMLSSESPSGAYREPLKRRARGVALALVGAMSFGIAPADGISQVRYTNIKQLADYQLTDKQYKCHNEIVYRESRFQINAVGNRSGTKQTYGYYQIKSKSLHKAPYDYQFYRYWGYVLHRYGYTEYDEPNYCKALHHLKTKGWQ